jgi:hypothetical protein
MGRPKKTRLFWGYPKDFALYQKIIQNLHCIWLYPNISPLPADASPRVPKAGANGESSSAGNWVQSVNPHLATEGHLDRFDVFWGEVRSAWDFKGNRMKIHGPGHEVLVDRWVFPRFDTWNLDVAIMTAYRRCCF